MPDANAARVWNLNHRLLSAVMNACAPQLDALGLDTKEFFVLGEVDDCRYPAALANRLMLPKPSVTGYLRSLVAKGFVTRELDDTDLRRHQIAITPAGRMALDGALAALSQEFDQWLGQLKDTERVELERLLTKLVDAR